MQELLVLGSTGSIGTQTLDVVRESNRALRVSGLAARGSWSKVVEQVREFGPSHVALADAEAGERVRHACPGLTVLTGEDALERLIERTPFDCAVHGVVGARGLAASVAVLERGKRLALANKESLVVAGALLMDLARRRGGCILPVDSELCAIHQCLRGETGGAPMGNGLWSEATRRVRRIILTASGGALRDVPLDELAQVSPEQALRHPNWKMGPRITVGSATLMNKALEVIEVHHLFGVPAEAIAVVLHRQSIVHSLVEFADGSVLAQLGPPDMRMPLHYCLHHPVRAPSRRTGFDVRAFAQMTFEDVDGRRFPALELGFRCMALGHDAGAVLNAADEVAVEAFLGGRIRFVDMVAVNERVLERRAGRSGDLGELIAADGRARRHAAEEIDALCATQS